MGAAAAWRGGTAGFSGRIPDKRGRVRRTLPFAELAGVSAARVRELILLAARHGRLAPGDVDDETARWLDCHLAILAAEPARYRRYDALDERARENLQEELSSLDRG